MPTSPRSSRARKRAAVAEEGTGKRRKLPTTKKKKKTAGAATTTRTGNRKKAPPPPPPPVARAPPVAARDEEEEEQKKEGKGTRSSNFIEEEDVYLCIAYVNVTTDGAVSTNQTKEDFWGRIQGKFQDQRSRCNACTDLPVRDWKSLRNRFDRRIKTSVLQYNKFYKALKNKNESGKKEEDVINEAHDKYLEHTAKPFPFSKCVDVLWALPKFNPMISDDTDDTGANQIDQVMGQGLDRPEGAKKQKAALDGKKKKKLDAADIASLESDKIATMKEMSQTSRSMANSMKYQADINGAQASFQASVEEARLLRTMGMQAEAMQAVRRTQVLRAELDRLRTERAMADYVPQHVNAPVPPVPPAPPADEEIVEVVDEESVSNVSRLDGSEGQEDLQSNEYDGPTTFRSERGVLDSGDEGDESSDKYSASENSHASQPSDDSRPKNFTKV